MKITKVLNNNAVVSSDKNNREVIILGKGIGFQKKPGDNILDSEIEKIFYSPSNKENQFEQLVEDIPYEHLNYADEIIKYASKKLDTKLNDYIYITLTDHISYAIERSKQGIKIKNTLLWEIQKYYKEEYQIGLEAVDFINKEEGINLPLDEAGFIALHIVNAKMEDENVNYSLQVPGMIKDILNIVKYTFNIEFDEESISYDRFVRHLKFFVQRGINNDFYYDEDYEFFKDFLSRYPKEYDCAKKIKQYVEKKTNNLVPEEELIYLTMHIARVTRDNSK